jgi:hypothetical protein
MNDATLAWLLLVIGDSLERKGQPSSGGLVRQAARRLAEGNLPPVTSSRPDRCEGCGTRIIQPRTGRPRRWCGRGVCAQENSGKRQSGAA